MANRIQCREHGDSEPTFACPHLLETLQDRVPRGLHWTIDAEEDIQAFCDLCWNATDAEWERLRTEGPHLLCLECLREAAAINDLEMDFSRR